MNYAMLVFAILITMPAAGQNSVRTPDAPTACQVALSFVKSFVTTQNGKIIVSSWQGESSANASDRLDYDWGITEYGRDTKATEPPPFLIKKFHHQNGLSAVEKCSIVKSYLRRNGIEFGWDAILRAQKDPKKSDFLILSVTLPALSDDKTMAILSNGQAGIQGGGGGWITAMSLDKNGNWERTFTAPTWIN